MKKLLFICLIVMSMMMVSCVKNHEPVGNGMDTVVPITVKLSEIEGKYEIEDMRELGKWVLSYRGEVTGALNGKRNVLLKIGERFYTVHENPLNAGLFMAFLPEELSLENIRSGSLTTEKTILNSEARISGNITIAKVVVEKAEQNATTLYEMTLQDYLFIKKAADQNVKNYLYKDGKLLRPVYVITSDGNAYTMQRYYNARQLASSHDVNGAFQFLLAQPNHDSELVANINPNRVSISNNAIVEEALDSRDRIRDLGSMGTLDGNNVYNIVNDAENGWKLVTLDKNQLPNKYNSEKNYIFFLSGATPCIFYDTNENGIVEATVTYATTESTELIRNARFDSNNAFTNGEGTKDSPFEISNADELNRIRNYLGDGYYFIQTANIDITGQGYSNWEPIAQGDSEFFYGAYDGDGFKITNLMINRPGETYVGLFGHVQNGTITNVTLEDATVTGYVAVGGLTGNAATSCIDNCHVNGTVQGTQNPSAHIGGLIGVSKYGKVLSSSGTVTVTGDLYIGGLIGSSSSEIRDCTVRATVTGNSQIGGFIGLAQSYVTSAVKIYTSSAYATVTAVNSGTFAGGFVGYFNGIYDDIIDECYSTGFVEGESSIGGFVGHAVKETGSTVMIEDCYSLAEASATGFGVGGFAGNQAFAVKRCYSAGASDSHGFSSGFSSNVDCFWDTETSGQGSSTGDETGKTSEEMRKETTFTNWDFTTVWAIDEGLSYPYLRNIEQQPHPGTLLNAGQGTEAEPYEISGWEQLAVIGSSAETLAAHYVLTVDLTKDSPDYDEYAALTANANAGWNPIGSESTPFTGSFTGKHEGTRYTISDLGINRNSGHVGLFGYTENATLMNITLTNASVTNLDSRTGVLAGTASGTTISGCHVEGDLNGIFAAGLLAGDIKEQTTIKMSYTDGTISGETAIGGFVGLSSLQGGMVENCYSTVDATGINGNSGGFVGVMMTGTIENCYSANAAFIPFAGGKISGVITDCFWLSDSDDQDSFGSTSKTDANMRLQGTFTNWDFSSVWSIEAESESYPYLTENAQDPAPGKWVLSFNGAGTKGDPYQVETEKQLKNISGEYLGTSGNPVYYIQTQDLDMTGYSFNPLGDDTNQFHGEYNGDGKKIQNLTISESVNDSGLFSHLASGATITNVELVNANVVGGEDVGGLAGNVSGFVENCTVTAIVSGNYNHVGGLTGHVQSTGVVENCHVTATVTRLGSYNGYMGSFCGINEGTIKLSSANGSVRAYSKVGGFVGVNKGTIDQCYSVGNAEGSSSACGGFVGENDKGFVINSYSTGNVIGSYQVGGFIGSHKGDGGTLLLSCCYSSGTVTSNPSNYGGFIGLYGSWVNSNTCCWDTEASGMGTSAGTGVVGKTTAGMRDSATFVGWDISSDTSDTIWGIEQNTSYPYLKNNEQLPHPGK